jgi:hypothetical protein
MSKDIPKFSENIMEGVLIGASQASDEMRQKLHIMEIQRDRAVEIALDCLNGRIGKEEILALADLILATSPNE